MSMLLKYSIVVTLISAHPSGNVASLMEFSQGVQKDRDVQNAACAAEMSVTIVITSLLDYLEI